MMMKRRHGEEPFAGQFKTQNLEDDGDGFEHENSAHDREEQLLFTTNRDHPDHPADRERAGVAHNHFGGMTIEPEETEASPDERGADDRQLAGKRIKWDLQVLRDAKVTGRVGEERVSKSDRDRAANREAVEPIGEIDRI
jgi:hypothetical protein